MSIFFYMPLTPFLPKATVGDKTLLVRDDVIGDLVVPTSAVIKWLNENGHDTYLVIRENLFTVGRLFLPEDKLILVDIKKYRKSIKYRYNFLKNLRAMGFKTAIGSTIHSSVNVDIVRNSGAPQRWGYKRRERDTSRMKGMNIVQTILLQKDARYTSVLEHERWFLSNIFSKKLENIALSPFAHIVKQPNAKLADRYIHYIADAGGPRRVYPKEKLLPILMRIADELDVKVVLTATQPFDFKHERCINLSGRTTLDELIACLGYAEVVIGNESGPTHLSWVLGNKTVMFYGGGHYGRFMCEGTLQDDCLLLTKSMPCFCCDWKCIHNEEIFPCINIDEVLVETELRKYFAL